MDAEKFAKIEITTEDHLWEWLGANHAQDAAIWLVTWKAAHRDRYVSRDQVLDALIAYGWIDGRRMKLDEHRTMQLISPRKQQTWARTYQRRAEKLEAEGRMHPAGRAALERAVRSGTLNAMAEVDDLIEPEVLIQAMKDAGAREWWRKAAPSYRRNILRWIASAKRDDTKAKRIGIAVDHAAKGMKVPNY